ncbi:AGE family epimerase/isomerase, partial [uncultured Bacteroides sp.]|uniref:AGE family epimerase/isomerase n=1 Tax=uncultured Bacteroides sp. TaxID=162156 RepID=UPI00280AA5CA
GTPVADAPRGGVLNARILWSFSAAYRTFGNESYLRLANRAQRYFIDTFIDKKNGGVYWLVNPDGEVVNDSKYTYAMTYAIYGLAEHFLATGNDESLKTAIGLYRILEEKGRDPLYDGYVESFTGNWEKLDQYDNNAPKTMNAHLHVLEAYTLLYQCWKDDGLKKRLEFCVDLFMNRIYDPLRKHFNLFFDNEWNSLVEMDSYGHDVEAGWLLCEAARTLENQDLIKQTNRLALDVTGACLAEGMSDKGYMIYERKGTRKAKHASWWGQIETMIACVNAWQISGDEAWLQSADTVWTFVKDHMIDKEYGEWYSDCFDGEPKKEAPKVSMWRCPYHTVRLGVEMYNRLK